MVDDGRSYVSLWMRERPSAACQEMGGPMIGPDGGKGAALAAFLRPHGSAFADAYAALLDSDSVWHYERSLIVRQAWEDLAEDARERARGIRLLLDVQHTTDAEPYPTAEAMCADIARGRFVVSTAHTEHPLWAKADNVAFRIVHDVLGHYAASIRQGWRLGDAFDVRVSRARYVAEFDWSGEVAACGAHAPLLPTIGARKALATECLAQTAYAIERGGFGPQRVGFIGHLLRGDAAHAYQQFTNER
jgi:hypothetical protein